MGYLFNKRDICALAAIYVDEIISLQSNGRYHIGGYCFAGLIAFEIAQQLTLRGHIVEKLILIEVRPELEGLLLSILRPIRRVMMLRRKLHRLNPGMSPVFYVSATVARMANHLKYIVTRHAFVVMYSRTVNDDNNLDRESYEMKPYLGALSLIYCEDSDVGAAVKLKTSHHILSRLLCLERVPQWLTKWECCDNVEIYLVPGDHIAVVNIGPYIRDLAEQIRVCLAPISKAEKPRVHSSDGTSF
jgi:thioesterase domain-containing protein